MSAHWRLAFWYAGWILVGAAVVGVAIWPLYSGSHAAAFLYGVGVGTISFVSTAFTVSLLTWSSKALGMMLGAGSFMARYGFVAVALGVPAYLELWPVVPMLLGFVGVYLAENVVLLPAVLMGRRDIARPVPEKVERRVEV